MKKILFLLLVLFTTYSFGQNFTWIYHISGTENQLPTGNRIATNNIGETNVIGTFINQTIIGADTLTSSGIQATYIAKYNSQGNELWAKKITGTIRIHGNALSIDKQNNVYVTGMFEGNATFETTTLTSSTGFMQDIYLAKYDSSGALIWVRQYSGSAFGNSLSIKNDTQSNIYLTGTYYGTRIFGNDTLTASGVYDMFLIKINSFGNVMWAKTFGGNTKPNPYDITLDGNLNIYTIGHFGDAFNGAITQFIVFGNDTLSTLQSKASDLFFVKFNNQGDVLFAKKMGGDYQNDRGLGIDFDGQNHLYLTGGFEGQALFGSNSVSASPPTQNNYSLFLAKYDLTGNCIWVAKPDTNISWQGMDVHVVDPNNIYVGGGVQNISLIKFDSSGLNTWSKIIGYSLDGGISLSSDTIGSIYMTSSFSDSLKTNIDTLFTTNLFDNFIGKIDTSFVSGISIYPNIQQNNLLKVYPNPVHEQLYFTSLYIRPNQEVNISIINIFGLTVYEKKMRWINHESIDIKNLPDGFYLLQLVAGNNRFVKSIIKQ